jgi:hypothetical protein
MFLFHATLDKNLYGIYQKGLIIRKKCNWKIKRCERLTFFTETFKEAYGYGRRVQREASWHSEKSFIREFDDGSFETRICYPDVIVLRINSKHIKNLQKDMVRKWVAGIDNEYYTDKNIKKVYIDFFFNGKWYDLQHNEELIKRISSGTFRTQSENIDDRAENYLMAYERWKREHKKTLKGGFIFSKTYFLDEMKGKDNQQ